VAQLTRIGIVALAAAAAVAFAAEAYADDPASDFKTNCSSCHTIGGGPLQGPDLKDVEKRQERAWLVRFILDPGGVIDSGDAYAV
jgi:mono/diheme cytochrome c family protein